jgi:eukaryotic-like serine/threonine-protein kinase
MTDSLQKANAPIRCKLCGAVLSGSRLDGLCPACTWGALSEADQDDTDPFPVRAASDSLIEIPGHVVVEEIARGGMGIVYRARQAEPERDVALKMLLPHQLGSAEMRERFRLEVRAIAGLEHPAILPVYQVGEHDGLPYFTMKLATGGTLASRADQYRGRFREVAELMVTVVEAVHFAHERGVLHRDLKPGNILFDDAGRPYVSDFGLAKFTGFAGDDTPALTRSIHLLGTPQFLPPEVAGGSVTHATTAGDVYSLGAVLYELLTGTPPFAAENLTTLLKAIVEREPLRPSKFRPGVPRDLEVICLKCLAKEPARRYASARELAEDLRLWLNGRPIRARPVSAAERVGQWARRNPALATVSVLLLLALAVGAALQTRTNRRLSVALAETRSALQESLLTQARLERTSGQMGQRFGALDLVKRAVALMPDNGLPRDSLDLPSAIEPASAKSRAELKRAQRVVALRTEVAGALALPDLRVLSQWPIHTAHFEGAAEFSDDLSRYAAASPGGGFGLFATEGQRLIRTFAGATNIPAVDFKLSRDGRWIAASFQDGHAEIHSVDTDLPPRLFPGHRDVRTVIEFLPDGGGFLVAGLRLGLAMHGFEGTETRVILPAPTAVSCLKLEPNGERVAAHARNAVSVFRVADGTPLWTRAWTNPVSRLAWSRDGRDLAVTEWSPPYVVSVLDAGSAERVTTFEHFGGQRIGWHPNGRSLATVGWDRRLVWRQISKDGFRLTTQADARVVQFSADGTRLAFEPSHGQVGLMEVALPAVFHEWQGTSPPDEESFALDVSPDGLLVATSSARGVQLWDAKSREQIDHIPLPNRMWFVTVFFHPDGRSVFYSAVGVGVRQVELARPDEPQAGKVGARFGSSRQLGDGTGFVIHEFAPDRRSLVVGENRRQGKNEETPPVFWLWPEADPARARKLAENFPATGYRLTRDGRWGFTTHLTTPDVWIWNPASGERLQSLGVKFPAGTTPSPDGRWLLVATREQYQLWEVGSWRPGPRWPIPIAEQGRWLVAFSPDSRLVSVASPSGVIELRALPGATEVLRLPPPQQTLLQGLQFSPDGTRLLVLNANGRLLEWDLAGLREELAVLGLDWAGK